MVGEILKKRREELGRDLRDISNILKIKHDYLKSIEDDAFDKLPEPVYVKGYIREYAEFLDVDAETVLKAYTEHISPPLENKTVPETEAPQAGKKRSRTLAISLILLIFAVIALFFVSPFTLPKKEPSSPPLKIDNSATSVDEPVVETSVPDTTKTAPSSLDSEPLSPAKPPAETKVETRKEFAPAADQSTHSLEIIASDITWLAITTDEAAPREVTMKPGETLNIKANKNISLKIGNAGGVKLLFNGKEIHDLGEKGEVITINLPRDAA